MDKKIILEQKKDRLNRLMQTDKNIKTPGVVRKLKREIRNLSSN
jgi:hypothetical protein